MESVDRLKQQRNELLKQKQTQRVRISEMQRLYHVEGIKSNLAEKATISADIDKLDLAILELDCKIKASKVAFHALHQANLTSALITVLVEHDLEHLVVEARALASERVLEAIGEQYDS